jgi:simple sugar transport system ATP-binding protein
VAVLRQGKLAGVREANQIDENEIAKLIVGGDVSYFETPKKREEAAAPKKEGIIAFDNVTVRRRGQKRPLLDKVSFSVASSEILGFAGVGGNGLGVIEAVLGGFLHPAEGRVLHCGKDISNLNIRRLREQGLSYVPADRLKVGSAASATIEENMIINCRQKFIKNLIFDKNATAEFSKKLTARYDIEGAQINDNCSSLSGGNLQKLILAREISNLKDYIVFSEPTWGLDINAGRFMTGEIAALRGKGAAVILISTNLDEILSLADRIIVMYRGRIAGELANTKDASVKEEIGRFMQGITGERQ